MREISGLVPVAHSLLRLVITEQKITKIEGLDLPNLRDLLLHCNQILRIENLQGCPKLQRLWLCSNKITKMENLACCGDLRELWLQVRARRRSVCRYTPCVGRRATTDVATARLAV